MLEVLAPLATADGVGLAVLATAEDGPGPFAPRLAAAGYDILHLPFVRGASFPVRLAKLLCRNRFDVVHVHCERAGFWIELAARLAGVPRVVRTVHAVFPFAASLRWRRMGQRAVARTVLGVATVAHSDSVIANERARFGNAVGFLPAWLDVAYRPPTAEQRHAARQRFGLEDGVFAVACVGSCLAIKNHDALLDAMARLVGGGVDAVLLHAGQGPLQAAEKGRAEALGIGNRIRFLGTAEDVRAVLHAADAFTMPSLREGLGMAAAEALACGVPAVLADVDGLREHAHAGDAVLWSGTDPATIAARLAELAALDPGIRRARGAEAAAAVATRYDPAAAWQGCLQLYGWSGDQLPR